LEKKEEILDEIDEAKKLAKKYVIDLQRKKIEDSEAVVEKVLNEKIEEQKKYINEFLVESEY
jgi:hypothetical protein